MQTIKGIEIPRTQLATVGTGLTSQIRIDKKNSFAFPFSFVSNKLLQLEKTPTVKPSVQSFSHKSIPVFSDTFQVLQNNSISRSNNLFADIVVNPTHITFLSASYLPKQSLGRLCAFTLKFFPQVLELDNFSFVIFENLAIRSDSKVIYSEINTQYLVSTRNRSIDLSGKSNMKKQSSFSIFDKLKSLVSPIKILPIILGDIYRNINPLSWLEGSKPDFFKRESEEFSVKRNRTFSYNRLLFKLGGFKIFRSFANSFNSKISREFKLLFDIFIDKMMKLKPVVNFRFKSFINSILNCSNKYFRYFKQFFSLFSFNLYGGDKFHDKSIKHNLYINFSEARGKFPSTLKCGVPFA